MVPKLDDFIEVKKLDFWYSHERPDSLILKDISLSIKKGEFIALVGPNGSGKSTLIRHLNGILMPCQGMVTVDGLDTRVRQNLPVIRRKVGMVFQNPDNQLFGSMVEEDVAFGVENLGLPMSEIRDRVNYALAQVGMSEYKNYPPNHLSGGQKQKVAIAGILAMQPECIVLDEPTSMLDPQGKREVLQAVRAMQESQEIAVVYVTNDMTETLYCHRLVALAGGEIIFTGTPEDFFAGPEFLIRTGLQTPPIKELVNALIYEGVKLPRNINSPEELVDAICL